MTPETESYKCIEQHVLASGLWPQTGPWTGPWVLWGCFHCKSSREGIQNTESNASGPHWWKFWTRRYRELLWLVNHPETRRHSSDRSGECSKQWHDTITGLIPSRWGKLEIKKQGCPPLGLHRGKRCSGICSAAWQKNPHSSICDGVAGGLLCSDDLCPLTSVLWTEGLLANTAAMKWCLKRSTGEFFSADPSALVL